MKKILASALAAAMILTNVNVFAEQKVDKSYLLQEDFSNFQNGGNGSDNNRIDKWRIEGEGGDGNATPLEKHLAVEDVAGMEKALVMKNRVQILRGGRDWAEDKHIGPGETLIIEFDIKPEAASQFIFGLHSAKNTHYAEDDGGHAAFMYLKPNDENVYVFPTQNRNDGTDQSIGNVNIKKNEINHVKVEYTVNKDISKGTYDILLMTVSNSGGTFTGSKSVNYRADNSDYDITGIRGINFWKNDKTSTLCIDNLEVYTQVDGSIPELLDKNYAVFSDDDGVKYTDLDEIPEEASALTLNFDSSIKSAAAGAVKITYGKNKELPVKLSILGQTVKAVIDGSLIPGFEYTVSIDSSKITGASGNAMKEDKSFKFTVTGDDESGAVVDGYVRNYYLQEDFSNFQNGGNDASNNRLDAWRIEGGLDGNGDLPAAYLSITDKDTMKGALRMGGEDFPTGGIIRGGRRYTSTIGAGESYIIEFDIYADKDAEISFGQHSEQENIYAEDNACRSYLFHLKPSSVGDVEKLWYHSDQSMNQAPNNSVSGVVFKRDEVNHMKIEYTFNDDVSLGTKDSMKITVTNSYGTTSGTVSTNYRYNHPSVKPLTGVQGITFLKWARNEQTEVYIDNLEVYSQYEDIEPEVMGISFTHSDETTESDSKNVNADVNEIKLSFNTAMKYATEYFDLTDSEGKRVSYTTSYSKGGTVLNIALPDMLKNDETYTLTVSAGALSKAGNALSSDYEYTFKTNAGGEMVIDSFELSENINKGANTTTITTSTELVKTFDGKQQYSLYIMAYDADKKLVDIGYTAIIMNSFGKGYFDKEITISNQDKVKTIKAVLCTYPNFKIVDKKTITR